MYVNMYIVSGVCITSLGYIGRNKDTQDECFHDCLIDVLCYSPGFLTKLASSASAPSAVFCGCSFFRVFSIFVWHFITFHYTLINSVTAFWTRLLLGFDMPIAIILTFSKIDFGERGGERDRGRERNTDSLFHLFTHSLVASCMCPDRGLNLQAWLFGTTP